MGLRLGLGVGLALGLTLRLGVFTRNHESKSASAIRRQRLAPAGTWSAPGSPLYFSAWSLWLLSLIWRKGTNPESRFFLADLPG